MADRESELTLVIKARDIGTKVVDGFGASIGKLGGAAERAAGRVGTAFRSVSSGITNGLGNLTESLAQGAGLGEAMFAFGAYMAGQAAESLVGGLLEKMAGSSLLAAIGGPLAAAGSAVGGAISAAIPIGMALLPALLVAALVAAVIFLVNNPEIMAKIAEVAGSIVGGILDGLAGLARLILGTLVAAPGVIADVVGGFVGNLVDWFLGIPGELVDLGANIVGTIVGGMVSLPGKVADVIRDAFANLKIDIGPFHITGKGVTIDLPEILPPGSGKRKGWYNTPGYAEGGWAGLHGPELAVLGEEGPEYVRRAGTGTGDSGGGGGGGFRIVGVSEAELVDMVDRALYFRLKRATPTAGI